MRAHSLVSQCIVVGDNKPFIAALVTIDGEALPGWLKAQGREGADVASLVDDEALRAEIQHAVDDANKAVSQAEAIKKFVDPADRLHGGGRTADTDAQAQAQRRDEGLRVRRRGALQLTSDALPHHERRRRGHGPGRHVRRRRRGRVARPHGPCGDGGRPGRAATAPASRPRCASSPASCRRRPATVRVAGVDAVAHPELARAEVGYCPDVGGLIPRATPWEHLQLAARLRGLPDGWEERARAPARALRPRRCRRPGDRRLLARHGAPHVGGARRVPRPRRAAARRAVRRRRPARSRGHARGDPRDPAARAPPSSCPPTSSSSRSRRATRPSCCAAARVVAAAPAVELARRGRRPPLPRAAVMTARPAAQLRPLLRAALADGAQPPSKRAGLVALAGDVPGPARRRGRRRPAGLARRPGRHPARDPDRHARVRPARLRRAARRRRRQRALPVRAARRVPDPPAHPVRAPRCCWPRSTSPGSCRSSPSSASPRTSSSARASGSSRPSSRCSASSRSSRSWPRRWRGRSSASGRPGAGRIATWVAGGRPGAAGRGRGGRRASSPTLLDQNPLRGILILVAAGGRGPLGRLAPGRRGAWPPSGVVAFVVGARACAWALAPVAPTPASSAARDRWPRRASARDAYRQLVRTDRASVWRSTALRRGHLRPRPASRGRRRRGRVWTGPRWSCCPGLVAAGAGLLFGVNAFCLDGSGAPVAVLAARTRRPWPSGPRPESCSRSARRPSSWRSRRVGCVPERCPTADRSWRPPSGPPPPAACRSRRRAWACPCGRRTAPTCRAPATPRRRPRRWRRTASGWRPSPPSPGIAFSLTAYGGQPVAAAGPDAWPSACWPTPTAADRRPPVRDSRRSGPVWRPRSPAG